MPRRLLMVIHNRILCSPRRWGPSQRPGGLRIRFFHETKWEFESPVTKTLHSDSGAIISHKAQRDRESASESINRFNSTEGATKSGHFVNQFRTECKGCSETRRPSRPSDCHLPAMDSAYRRLRPVRSELDSAWFVMCTSCNEIYARHLSRSILNPMSWYCRVFDCDYTGLDMLFSKPNAGNSIA